MLMPASSEFVSLCRSQVTLAASLGATFSIVYLTEDLAEGSEAKLIPIAAYPETFIERDDPQSFVLLSSEIEAFPRLLAAENPHTAIDPSVISYPPVLPESDFSSSVGDKPETNTGTPWEQRQIILPLMHEGAVMGLLVSGRRDRAWNELEEAQMQRIAHTLAIACIIDQRSQWIEQEFTQQRQLQAKQYDTLHTVLHQFKSPLTALRTFGKLLLKRLRPGDNNREVANSIVRESDRLQELLQQIDRTVDIGEAHLALPAPNSAEPGQRLEELPALLDASPLLQLPASEDSEILSVAEVLAPLLISAKAIAEEQQLTLSTEIPEQLPLVQGNAKALREVLSNLIDNALKYTPAGGQVYVKVRSRAALKKSKTLAINLLPPHPNLSLAIAISDTGAGIPPQDLEHLFERHYRGEKAQTDIPGTGLGLAIARELIESMSGEIQVFSPAHSAWIPARERKKVAGKGTSFILWLKGVEESQ